MNRADIRLLQSIRGYPAVSILLPTFRTSPANKGDPIRVKNLVLEAGNRLLSQFSKREVEAILTRMEKLAGEIDFRNTLDGLALFVNQDFSRLYYLPFPLKERVVIDDSFATRDLVFAMNRTPRYWTLVLSEKPTRLYEGTRESLVEITGNGFPMLHGGPGGATPLPGGFGVRKSAYRDERHRQFFRQVDEAFSQATGEDPLPLALVGVDRNLAFFDEVSRNKDAVVARITGSHDKTSSHELGKLVWPAVKAELAARRRTVLDELEAAISAGRAISTLGEAWRLAQDGRGAILVVEEDYHPPARLDESRRHLRPADDLSAPIAVEDAVDDLVEKVIEKGGRVVFVDDGALEKHGRVALILRY